MLTAIVHAFKVPELRRRLGAAGREYSKGFTAAAMAQKYLDVYREVLGKLE